MMPLLADAQVSNDLVKIGVLTDLSGPGSTPTGQGSVVAAQMAVDDFGGKVLGKRIVVISGNHQINPDGGDSPTLVRRGTGRFDRGCTGFLYRLGCPKCR